VTQFSLAEGAETSEIHVEMTVQYGRLEVFTVMKRLKLWSYGL